MSQHRASAAPRRALAGFWRRVQALSSINNRPGSHAGRAIRPRRARLAVEALEGRVVLSVSQWADTVVAFSSEFPGGWSAPAALGAPNVFAYGDLPGAWAPAAANGGNQFITVGYNAPLYASAVTVRETYGNGFVYQIDVVDTNDVYHTAWAGTDPSQPGTPVDFTAAFPTTRYAVKAVKVYVDTSHSASWEEIDAIRLTGETAPPNAPPTAVADTFSTPEDITLRGNVLENDRDPDGDALTATVLTSVSHGTLDFNPDGTFAYVPGLNYSGTDSFTYRVADAFGGSATATVTLTVAPVNDPPLAAADAASTSEDTAVTIAVLANDSAGPDDGETLTVASVTQPVFGSVAVNADGTVTYTPTADYYGDDVFTYAVSDGNGGTATAEMRITVTPVNDPPVARDDRAAVDEDTAVTVTVLGNDDSGPDVGETLSITEVTQGAHGRVALNADGTVTYTPNADYNGPDSFTYTISDGHGAFAAAAVSVTVAPVNDPPVADSGSVTVNEDGTTEILLSARDPEGSPLVYAVASGPAHGTLSGSGAHWTYTPAADFNGADGFTFRASDGSLDSDLATVSITVTAVNDAPTAQAASLNAAEDGPAIATGVLADDVDSDNDAGDLAYTILRQPAAGSVVSNGDGTFTFSPGRAFQDLAAGEARVVSFDFKATDRHGADSPVRTVTVTVSGVNDAPVAADDRATTAEDGSASGNVLTNDADVDTNDALTVVLVTAPGHGNLVFNSDGSYTYTPGAGGEAAGDSFTYRVIDNHGGVSAVATASITITHYAGVVDLLDGILRVGGGAGADVVTVSGGDLIVNGVARSLAGVTEVRVWGRGGNDRVDLTGLGIKSFISGGDGDDTLVGGSGSDQILGGAGNDTVTGRAGNDILVGGDGMDRIVGAAGHDVLIAGDIGGSVTRDSLWSLLETWAAGRNGDASSDDTLDETLIADGGGDLLTGSAGADLFFINLADRITDFKIANWDSDVVVYV